MRGPSISTERTVDSPNPQKRLRNDFRETIKKVVFFDLGGFCAFFNFLVGFGGPGVLGNASWCDSGAGWAQQELKRSHGDPFRDQNYDLGIFELN